MFKLTIGEMNCAVSDFEHDTFCFYTFDARKDIFNLNDGDTGLRFCKFVLLLLVELDHSQGDSGCFTELLLCQPSRLPYKL